MGPPGGKWRVLRKRLSVVRQERYNICGKWRYLPKEYFENMDMIIDNTQWDIPTNDKARDHLIKHRVRGHLRTPSEGLKPEFTKPSRLKHRINPAGVANLCAGISKGEIAMWEYIQKRWSGEVAAAMYRGPIAKALRKHVGDKDTYSLLEDNDPKGYKSSKGKAAKKELGIKPLPFPRYSPDLMPLDYSIWEAIRTRMDKKKIVGKESADAFKKRLRMTALRLPKAVVRQALLNMKTRIKAIYAAEGGRISID